MISGSAANRLILKSEETLAMPSDSGTVRKETRVDRHWSRAHPDGERLGQFASSFRSRPQIPVLILTLTST